MRTVGGLETKRNVLVDGNNLIHRVHHAFVESRIRDNKPVLCNRSGFPTGLIYGFLSMLSSWMYSMNSPTSLSVFFDGVPRKRLALDQGYKAGRDSHGINIFRSGLPVISHDGKSFDNELELLSHILELIGIDVYHHRDEEADDLIASYVKSKVGEVHIIVSSDKDFFQLVNDRVVLFRPGSEGFFDVERVTQHMDKLYGVRITPSQIHMFKSLTGDSSDNIPGIPRIRKKVAAKLCVFETVDEMYESGLLHLSSSEKLKALEFRERVSLNHKLVGFMTDININECRRPGQNRLLDAKDLCRDVLDINSIDFDILKVPHVVRSAVPVHDWLSDI